MMGGQVENLSAAKAVVSMLGEAATPGNSAGRMFRERPVLAWTLERLSQAKRIGGITLLCWEDQAEAVKNVAGEWGAEVLVKPRGMTATLEKISAAQRWSDGWRGGLLGTCHFDRGFHAGLIAEALADAGVSLVVLVSACSGLVDPELLDGLVDHAERHSHREFFFTQAAPGLAGVALRPELIERLAKAGAHPGRLLAYSPDTPGLDPITNDMCVPVAPAIARTGHSFALDSDRQIGRVSSATESLNGELIGSGAERICALLDGRREVDAQPREVVLELTTQRASRPIFSPVTHLEMSRGDMSIQTLTSVLDQLKGIDDLRLTLAGTGDPLLHPQFAEMLRLIAQAGIGAVHIETDLLELSDEALAAMVDCQVDVMSIHLPAAKAETYRTIMGADGLGRVLENLKRVLGARRALPLVAPIFTKCRENLEEMEPWYDHWLRVLGSAVIVGASDYAGQIPDHAAADMSPPRRRSCGRLQSRMTVQCDGTIPSCEQDVLAVQPMGHVTREGVAKSWRERLGQLRKEHLGGGFERLRICGKCREWHRP